MDYLDAVVTVVDLSSSSGYQVGRTAIQKLIYFALQKGVVEDRDTYFPHYYGPYSREVARALSTAVSIDFVEESAEELPEYEGRRYIYTLTDSGKALRSIIEKEQTEDLTELRKIVSICKKTTGLNMQIMACAAKVHYLLKQKNGRMTTDEIKHTAQNLGWKLASEDIDKAADLLVELDMAKRVNRES